MHKEKVKKKSIASIVAALESYDGCEVDIRLTRDRVFVLFHDAEYEGRRLLQTDYKDINGIQTLEELLHHPRVVSLVNDFGKTLWIEIKEDTTSGLKKDLLLSKDTANRIRQQLKSSELQLDNIRIISFAPEILTHIKGVRTLRIVPYIFTATEYFFPYYNFKTIWDMVVLLRWHIQATKRMEINGLLFSKMFLRGFFSLFQPSIGQIKSWVSDDFILGTEAQTFEEEKAFKEMVVITDYRGERKGGRGKNAGPLICHRGL